jgi:hypothetical protein
MTVAGPIKRIHAEIVRLRMSVGLLGETANPRWWSSTFVSTASQAFLTPIFGMRTQQARYQGLVEAARLVHDDRIGIGRAFHLFRLPDHVEHCIFEITQLNSGEVAAVETRDAADAILAELSAGEAPSREGPTMINAGEGVGGKEWVGEAAALYRSSFAKAVQCFPYFRDL